jgi:hypothetical protein
MKLPMPAGKITVRHRQMRNVFQCFAGRHYLVGASADTDDGALESLVEQYDVPAGIPVTVYGYKHPILTVTPEQQ